MASQGNNDDDVEAVNNYVVEEGKYLRLYRATVQGNWEGAQILFNQHDTNNSIVAPLNDNLDTALHVAAKRGGRHASFAEKLVAELPDEALLLRNRKGLAPLHLAARYGNIGVAKILVQKNPNLLYDRCCNNGLFPIHYAARNTLKSVHVYRYFLGVTKDDEDGEANPYQGPSGATILVNLIKSKFYGVAMELADKYPDLTRHHTLDQKTSPLAAIVKYDYPIFNKTRLRFWQTSIHYSLLWEIRVHEKMLMHDQAVKLLECLCDKLKILNSTKVASLAKEAIIEAAYLDIEEVVQNIVEAYPTTAYYKDKSERNILHIAVENRCINVFNLVCGPCQTSVLMHDLVEERDNNGNNILHLAGKLAPPNKLNLVSGAALQMQRELQWFKGVQKIASPYFSSLKNKDGKTPAVVFTEEHKGLKMEGEKWMKDTATSCSIAAALIVTIAFAAAITVPGGNDDKDGVPIFYKRTIFKIFYYSNGASLFASITSLLVFLSILTSRYAEEDFLCALPWRLITGLFMLLLSIMAMITSFCATVYFVFGAGWEGRGVNGVILIVLAFVSVAFFVVLQFPLLIALMRSTFVWSIFNKRGVPQMSF